MTPTRRRVPRRALSRLVAAGTIAGVALLGITTSAHAQFEGTVTMHMSTGRGGNDMTYAVKNGRMRMDIGGPMGAMYMIRQGEKNSVVIPTQHMYFEQVIPAGTAVPDRAGTAVKRADINFTGKKEMIAGYECEHAIVTSDDGQFDICLAKGLGTFMAPSNPMGGRGRGGDDGPASAALKKLGGEVFPLKVQKVGGDVSLEVTKIEKKSLDESMFTVPSDYKKVDLGAMMGRPPGAE